MKTSLSIFDIDGVLADSTQRYRVGPDGKIDLAFWRNHQHLAYGDTLHARMHARYLKDLEDKNIHVIVATARELREPDDCWIRDKLGAPASLISRKIGDNRSGGLLKVLGINKLLALKQFANVTTLNVFEDNHTYLKVICDAFADRFQVNGHYIPSKQGH